MQRFLTIIWQIHGCDHMIFFTTDLVGQKIKNPKRTLITPENRPKSLIVQLNFDH